MAELKSQYLAEMLTSRQLLALLFVSESQRKKTLESLSFEGGATPPEWAEFLERFAARLAKLPEPERVYLLGSHLQSAEEIDIYSNAVIQTLLESHSILLGRLTKDLEEDPRFA